MSPAAYLASPSESSDSASSEEPCPAPVDGHSWPLQSSSTDSDGLSQPLARYSRLSISHHALTHVLPNVPIRHYARGKHTRTQKSGSESSDCARRTARVIVAVAYVRRLLVSQAHAVQHHVSSLDGIAHCIDSATCTHHCHRFQSTRDNSVSHSGNEERPATCRQRELPTLHIRQVKPRDVAACDQRLIDPHNRGLCIPLVCIAAQLCCTSKAKPQPCIDE